jgi:hypothetical protein
MAGFVRLRPETAESWRLPENEIGQTHIPGVVHSWLLARKVGTNSSPSAIAGSIRGCPGLPPPHGTTP